MKRVALQCDICEQIIGYTSIPYSGDGSALRKIAAGVLSSLYAALPAK